MKCEWCPLKNRDIPCYSETAKICFHLDENHPRFNPAYAAVIERESLIEAGKIEREPLSLDKAPVWLQNALGHSPALNSEEASTPSLEPSEKEMPSLWQQAISFTKSAVKHTLNRMKPAREEVRLERLRICGGCEYLAEDRRCRQCGCPVDTKTTWASEKCPINKWLEDTQSNVPEDQGGNCGEK